MTDKTREDFEAAIRTNLGDDDGWFILGALGDYASDEVQNKWEGYQAATQQSAARIAALEADRADFRNAVALSFENHEFQRRKADAATATVYQFHYAMKDAGWHPGRTDDNLCDIIRAKGAELARLEAEVLALRKAAERQISDGEFEPSAKLMELADKIDHEQNWRNSGIFQRDHLTQDQQDRVLAGVMLRRYADLMAPESWRLFPPARARAVAHSYRASTLEAVVKMAKKYCRAAIEAERGEG